ncbi:PAS domain-containing sensor histidine kinase [Streptomyces sp. RTd22]|uniref:PAS domain-containing sensor histidine kinase n=1 Tax=Streptomyces sp. RTd22 TaxID=1841249 RepID=UPI0007C4FA32|nr:ATP-binding protein [Streptomyces sp. RTd22]
MASATASAAASAADPDGIIAIDDRGLILCCNTAAAELFDRPAQQLIGQPFGFPLVPEPPTRIELLRTGGTPVAVDMLLTATTPGDMRLHIATLRDITRRRRAEEGLRAALEHQQVIVGVAAHELHGPLFKLRTMVNTLRTPGSVLSGKQRDEAIDRIGDTTVVLESLLRKLLLATRIDVGAASFAQIVPLHAFLLERLRELGEKAERVHLDCPERLAVLADPGELAAMVDDYLDNAFAHGLPPVEVCATGQNGWIELRVCDRGPGVPETFVPHLFQRFSRPPHHPPGVGGAGLGLWIVAAFAEANGGRAWHEPNPGGGSCFCLRLTRAAI